MSSVNFSTKFGNLFSKSDKAHHLIPCWDYDADLALIKSTDKEVILSDVNVPLDQPATLRYAMQDVKDVYKNTEIQPLYRQNGVRGKSALVSGLYTAKVTQSGETVEYPVKCGITLQFPVSADLDENDLYTAIAYTVGAMQDYLLMSKDSGVDYANDAMINKIARGQLDPRDGQKIS